MAADQQHVEEQINKSLMAASQSWKDLMSSVNVFQFNVQRRHFDDAEGERQNLHALLDDYIDQYLVAGKLVSEMK